MILQMVMVAGLLVASQWSLAQKKPIVWIYTDMSDKNIKGREKEGSANDPDDISAMAGYLLMCNEFDTRGIVVASTHRKEHQNSPDQAVWAQSYFGKAYQQDYPKLNKALGGYPKKIRFMQSAIKSTAERFQTAKTYNSLKEYSSILPLFKLAKKSADTINVLCWGSLTEPAILVNFCLNSGNEAVLKKLRFIAHWTNSPLHQGSPEHPENVANCREDASACAYLKEEAKQGRIRFYELGAIGQHGIVSGQPKGEAFYSQYKGSALGKIFVEGKFVFNGVDHSDAATYWTLLGDWGVRLSDVAADGSNPASVEEENENRFKKTSLNIHNELLRRAKLAAQ